MPQQPDNDIRRVQELMAGQFSRTPFSPLLDDPSTLLTNQGKMLRSRLVIRMGRANGTPDETILRTAAAVELIHTASLLHDDVIDNGLLRRAAPAYWQKHGISGAILLGDLLVFYALKLLMPLQDQRLAEALIGYLGEVGEAEVLQEIVHRGTPQTWDECVETARHKTGPLFAFMGFAAAGPDETLAPILAECGYLAGTAYQLSDDYLDAFGSPEQAGKTVGRDHLRGKNTSALFSDASHIQPPLFIEELCERSIRLLDNHPALQTAWRAYLDGDLLPPIRSHLIRPPSAT